MNKKKRNPTIWNTGTDGRRLQKDPSDRAERSLPSFSTRLWNGFWQKGILLFNCRLIILQYCTGFCHTLTWISHGCTYDPHPKSPWYLPPHPIPQGHPSAPALSTLSHASNLDWRSISHMVIYRFQCYSIKSSYPNLLPQSAKLCSLHLCLFCFLCFLSIEYPLAFVEKLVWRCRILSFCLCVKLLISPSYLNEILAG